MIGINTSQMTRDICEAFEMNKTNNCAHSPYVSLSKKKILFLLWDQPVMDDLLRCNLCYEGGFVPVFSKLYDDIQGVPAIMHCVFKKDWHSTRR